MYNPSANRFVPFWNRYVVNNLRKNLIRKRAINKAASKLKNLLSRRRLNRCIRQLADEPKVMLKRISRPKDSRHHHRNYRRSHRSESSASAHRRRKKARLSCSDHRRDKKSLSRSRDSFRESRRHSTPEVTFLKNKKQIRPRSPSEDSLKPSDKRAKNQSPLSPQTTISSDTSTSGPASPVLFSKGRRKSRVPEQDDDKTSSSSRTSDLSECHNDARKIRQSLDEKLLRVKRKEKVENSRKYYRPKHKFDLGEYKKIFSPPKKVQKFKSSSTAVRDKNDNISKSTKSAVVSNRTDDNIVMSRMESIRSGTRKLEFEKNLDDLVSSVGKDGKNKFVGPKSLDQLLSENPSLDELLTVKSKIENHLECCTSPKFSLPSLDATSCDCHKLPTVKAPDDVLPPVESIENDFLYSTKEQTVKEHIHEYLAKNNIDVSVIKEALQTCRAVDRPNQPESSINTVDNEVSSTTDHIESCKPLESTETFATLTTEALEYIQKDVEFSFEEIMRKSSELQNYTNSRKTSKPEPIAEQSIEKPTVPVSNVTSCVITPVKTAESFHGLKTLEEFIKEMPKKQTAPSLLMTMLNEPSNVKKSDVDSSEIVKIPSEPNINTQNPPVSTEKPLVKIPNSLIVSPNISSTATSQSRPQNQPLFTPTNNVNIPNALPHQKTDYIMQNATISTVQSGYAVSNVQYPIPMATIYPSNGQAMRSNFDLLAGGTMRNQYNLMYVPTCPPSTTNAAPANARGPPPSNRQFVTNQSANHNTALVTTKATLVCPPTNPTPVCAGQGAASVRPPSNPARPAGGTKSVHGSKRPVTADASAQAALPSNNSLSIRPAKKPTSVDLPMKAVKTRPSSGTASTKSSTKSARARASSQTVSSHSSRRTSSTCSSSRSTTAGVLTQAASTCSSNNATAFEMTDLKDKQRDLLTKVLWQIHVYNSHHASWRKKYSEVVDAEQWQRVDVNAKKELDSLVLQINDTLRRIYHEYNTHDTGWVAQRIAAYDAKANPNTARITVEDIFKFITLKKQYEMAVSAHKSEIRMDPRLTSHQSISRPATQGAYPVESPRGYPSYANPRMVNVQPTAAVKYAVPGVQGFNAPARVPVPVPAPMPMSIRASSAVSVSVMEPAPVPVAPPMPIPPTVPKNMYKIYLGGRKLCVPLPANPVKMTKEQSNRFQTQTWQYRQFNKELNRWMKEKKKRPARLHREERASNTAGVNSPVLMTDSTPTPPQTTEKLAHVSQESQSVASQAPPPMEPAVKKSQTMDLTTAMDQLLQFNSRKKSSIEKPVITLEDDLAEEVLDLSVKTPSLEIIGQNKPVASVKPLSNPESAKKSAVGDISTVPAVKKVPETANNAEKPRPDGKIDLKPRNIIEIDLSDDETVVKVEVPENSEYMVDVMAADKTKCAIEPLTDSQAPITIDSDDDDDRHSTASTKTVILDKNAERIDDDVDDDVVAFIPSTAEELECTSLAKEMGIKSEYMEDLSSFYPPMIMGVTTIDPDAFDQMPKNVNPDGIGNANDPAMRLCDNCNVKKIQINCTCNQVGYCSHACIEAHYTKHASSCINKDDLGIKVEVLDDDCLLIQS